MSDEIRYSIIIPHYNTPSLLRRLIESIPVREDIQVIVVDDCSKGYGESLPRSSFLKRANVEVYVTERNGGGGYARNEGLRHAVGKWLLFADADDLFTDGFDTVLDRYYHEEEDIILFHIKSVCSDDLSRHSCRDRSRIAQCKSYMRSKDDKVLRYGFIEPWAKMIRRTIVERHNVRFDETKLANDYFFSIQTGYYAGKVRLADDRIYILTQSAGSVSSGGWGDTRENQRIRLDVIARAQLFLQDRGVVLVPMPLRGIMVNTLKRYPLMFFKELCVMAKTRLPVVRLLWQMIRYMRSGR